MIFREERNDEQYRPVICEVHLEGSPKEYQEMLEGIKLTDSATSDLGLRLCQALRRAGEDG